MMKILNVLSAIFLLFFLTGCKKDENSKLPDLSTSSVSEITETTASGGGYITSEGESPVTSRGVCWSTSQSPTIADSKTNDGEGDGGFITSLTELTANTTYYVRAFAVNSFGTAYGENVSFKTSPVTLKIPTLTTNAVSVITPSTASSGGSITSDGGSPVTVQGVCWSINPNPTIADSKILGSNGTINFTCSITGLTVNTTYYARSYATNSIGTAYGNEVTFAAWLNQAGATVLDIEGNSYSTVKIGDQVWMAENLKTSKYRNGEPISNVADNTQWTNIPIGDYSQGAYCNYSNNAANADTYGRLYNWYAVTNSRNICPQGWHVPSDAEWKKLEAYLGGWLVAGGKMKEIGATHWSNSNIGATNESGFTALPGGYRFSDATFNDISSKGYWWSSTELTTNPTTHALSRVLNSDNAKFSSFGYPKNSAFSVRCIKD